MQIETVIELTKTLEIEDEVNQRLFLKFTCVDESNYVLIKRMITIIDQEKQPIMH
jgi:hypothetical protein